MSGLEWFLVLFAWLSVAIFIVGNISKAIKFSNMPLNLRWEVYPIPHEEAEKRHYGGSYMEEMDWAKKPPHSSLAGELAEMGSEIFFLKRVREYNQFGIWIFSMALHWGIYLLFASMILLLVEAVLKVNAISYITNIIGIVSFVLGAFGCITLMIKRATTEDLAIDTPPVLYFNLLFLLSIFITGILSWIADSSLDSSRKYIEGVLFFRLSPAPVVTILNFLLFNLFLIYTPYSKFLHYLAKYFNFHQSLWDDKFKQKDSETDKKIIKQLSYRIKWAGPHSVPGKTWLEGAQDYALEEKKGGEK